MSLEVLEVNGLVTVQGEPRWGRRHFGVPEGGAWDTEAHHIANAMLRNPIDRPVFELSLARIVLRATHPIRLATAGAPTRIATTRQGYSTGAVIPMLAGERAEIVVPTLFARVYVAAVGGIDATWCGRVVGSGATLLTGEAMPNLGPPLPANDYDPNVPERLEVIPFGDEPLPSTLVNSAYTVDFRTNRVGIRLEGPSLPPRQEGLSEPVCHGSIQVDNSGSLIILGPDGPTIGGYPKIGAIASHHLHHLGQLRPGAQVRFSASL